jgi:putative component of membrane protein insertase Oxa1/YidC/SpoIIIJ protein YidD
MRPGLSARLALRGIDRYQHSEVRERISGCCRFSPSCSHYAQDALHRRSFAAALLLITWRLLRCNPLTPRGTVDQVRPTWMTRRQLAGVLTLSGLLTMLVAGSASAASTLAQSGGSSITGGGCSAFIGGVPINSADRDHPLQVHKGQRILLTGQAPAAVRASAAAARSTTDVTIVFIKSIASKAFTESATGPTFQRSVGVDTYLKYGSGVYRVDIHSVAPGAWDCAGTFYVEMNGSKLAAIAAVTMGALGTAGMAAAAAGDPPPKEPEWRGGDSDVQDPGMSAEEFDKVTKDRAANAKNTTAMGCLLGIFFAMIAATGAATTAPPPAMPASRDPHRVYTRGHPVLGFISGLFAGLGITVALQQFGFYPLDLLTFVVAPLVAAVLGAWRGWRGTAWTVR